MEHLSRLLPGFFPSPAVLELVEQILNRPPPPVVEYDPGGGQRYIGTENQAWFGPSAIIIDQLAPDNPYGPAVQESCKHNGRAVVHHLGLTVDKAFHADFRQ